jgi:hypothetical protein
MTLAYLCYYYVQDVIVEVPAECALQVTNDKQATPFAEFCPQEVWKAYKWDGRLAMCLLHVKHSQSKLAEQLSVWLEVLPRSFGTPLSWEDTSLQQLQYPPLIEQVSDWAFTLRSINEFGQGVGAT